MTGLRDDQVAEVVTAVFGMLGEMWQPVKGRRRVLGLYRAVALTLFLIRVTSPRQLPANCSAAHSRPCPGSCAGNGPGRLRSPGMSG